MIQTIDAKGNVAAFEYDLMGNLTKVTLHRVDTQDGVDEYEVTLYEYDGRGLVTKVVDALGNVTTTEYDGNGNVSKVTDADGYVTEYTYNALDMVTNINYNGGKEASYQYNAVGDLVRMEDWTGINTFEVDLLNRITKVTDHKGKVVTYGYDATGNQTSIGYPDGSSVTKTYDLVNNLESVTETDGRTTTYTYDGMRRVIHMEYPDGWQEDYTYDAIGQLLSIYDTDPSGKDMKQQKNRFEYDACGNMTYEYMRGNGTGEATVEVYYTYDELHQVVTAQENYGNKSRSYQYDSLGNLTWETNSNNVTVDYKLNNLNQITTSSDDGWKTSTTYTYDDRGNLIQELYTKNNKQSITGAYTFDETNKMVKGVNDLGESSEYLYNGLGALVTNTWTIKKNAYGYHDVTALTTSTMVEGEIVVDKQTGKKEKKDKKDPEVVLADAELNKTSTVVKDFVIDYTVETMDPLYETESTTDGLEYRYVYGLDDVRLSVTVKGVENGAGHIIENGDEIRLYYHQDLRGTVDYLTSPVSSKVESWTHYNEWGEITHNAVLKCGQRELDLVKNYTGHEYDAVLGMYYAKARFYDAENRRFISMDPVKGNVMDPMSMVQYLYVKNGPLTYIDSLGKYLIRVNSSVNPATYEVVKEDEAGAFLETAITSFIPLGEWGVALKQREAGYAGGSGFKNGPESIIELLDSIDDFIDAENILITVGNKVNSYNRSNLLPSLKELSVDAIEQIIVVTKGAKPADAFKSIMKKVSNASTFLTVAMAFAEFGKTGHRMGEDDVFWDLYNKIALDDSKYVGYLSGWTDFDALEAMMEEAIDVLNSTSDKFDWLYEVNMREEAKGNDTNEFNRNNYFYFFVCLIAFDYDYGSSSHTITHMLHSTMWDSDRQVLLMSEAEYNARVNAAVEEYYRLLNPQGTHPQRIILGMYTPTLEEYEALTGYDAARARILHYASALKDVFERNPKR